MTYFISGGAKNGKSSLAQELAVSLAQGGPHYYLATMIPVDEEDRERIRLHREDRAQLGFETVECGRNLMESLENVDWSGTFLLDSVTALLMNELFDPANDYALDPQAGSRCIRDLEELARRGKHVIFVSDYIYSDAQHYDETTQCYRRQLAQIDCRLAQVCQTVVEASAGQYVVHKGALPV